MQLIQKSCDQYNAVSIEKMQLTAFFGCLQKKRVRVHDSIWNCFRPMRICQKRYIERLSRAWSGSCCDGSLSKVSRQGKQIVWKLITQAFLSIVRTEPIESEKTLLPARNFLEISSHKFSKRGQTPKFQCTGPLNFLHWRWQRRWLWLFWRSCLSLTLFLPSVHV